MDRGLPWGRARLWGGGDGGRNEEWCCASTACQGLQGRRRVQNLRGALAFQDRVIEVELRLFTGPKVKFPPLG